MPGLQEIDAAIERPITVFNFQSEVYTEDFRNNGYVHIKGGISPAFFDFAMAQWRSLQTEPAQSISAWEVKNKKQQFLFELPSDSGFFSHVFHNIATVADLPVERMTISERHLKAYLENAAPNPPLHKDRLSSQVAVGIPLIVPEESQVILYPYHLRGVNVFDSAAQFRQSLDEKDSPEALLENVAPVLLNVRPGDVVIFLGSEIYHERLNAAGAVVLYIKLNGMRLDPLCEDPSTPLQRQRSLAILGIKADIDLADSIIEVSPRLQRISTHYFRHDWCEVTQAYVSGEKEILLNKDDIKLLMTIRYTPIVRDLFKTLGVTEKEFPRYIARAKRLGELGVIDFLT
jgi:hypothetical protein